MSELLGEVEYQNKEEGESSMGNISYDFSGKVLAITGASGGIGKAIALAFGKAGAKVMIADLKEEMGQAVADEINAGGGTAAFQITNVADEESVKAFIQNTLDTYGQLDILVNVAGVGSAHKGNPFTNLDDEDFHRTWSVNFLGAVHTCRAVYEYMKNRGYGRIINVTSVVWRSTNLLNVPYVTSKAAGASLVLNLAKELGPYGITVNNLCPGYVHTPMYEGFFARSRHLLKGFTGQTVEEMVDWMAAASCATKTKQTPEQLAAAALFLASDEAAQITGTSIEVAGGYKL